MRFFGRRDQALCKRGRAATVAISLAFLAGAVSAAGPALPDDRSAERAPSAEMSATLCATLLDEPVSAALVAQTEALGWTVADALETAECAYIFIHGGAPSPAGHMIVARYGNHALIDWLSDYYAARRDLPGLRRLFGRRGESGDARAWLESQIRRFRTDDPGVARLYIRARLRLDIALNRKR
ncbi:MAG: hypothetical protein AAFW46_04500 [Pseudomonadota bacterium]